MNLGGEIMFRKYWWIGIVTGIISGTTSALLVCGIIALVK